MRREDIVDKMVDDLRVTEAGLSAEKAEMFRKYVDLHANDLIRHMYGENGVDLEEGESFSEGELVNLIDEVVYEYKNY